MKSPAGVRRLVNFNNFGGQSVSVNQELIRKSNLVGVWCGLLYFITIIGGWWFVAGMMPLHDPAAGAEEIAGFYRGDEFRIRVGMVIVMFSAAFLLPYNSAIADYVYSVEGRSGPLTRTTLTSGYANAMLTLYPPLWWLTIAFRTERPDEMIYLLNDIAWLQFIGGVTMTLPIFLTVSFAILNDKLNRVFPRWFGFYGFWVFVIMCPNQLLFFFKSGPFAWNGLLALWLPIIVFLGWYVLAFHFLRKHYQVAGN